MPARSPARKPSASDPGLIAGYKTILREYIDRRPAGMRARIAAALGKHKSFVSQLTNPIYPMPIPARHIETMFDICHFSPAERRDFLKAYQRAHPERTPDAMQERGAPARPSTASAASPT